MKKNDIVEGIVEKIEFPNKGYVRVDDQLVLVKNTIQGQKLRLRITKKRRNKIEGKVLEIIEPSPIEQSASCKHFGKCGGCLYQSIPYEKQLELKSNMVKELLDTLNTTYEFEGIVASPNPYEYRNKMEYSFGDEYKDGPLALGMHKRGSFYDIVTVNYCCIVDKDFNRILGEVLKHFSELSIPYYRKRSHEGYLRHLVVRKGIKTNEFLINLVTSSQLELNHKTLVKKLRKLDLTGKIVSIYHTINDSLADAVISDELHLLYGQEYYTEELLNLKFKISPFSFFQTNVLGAEKLYSIVREYVGDTKDKVICDLYCGTGTITQLLASVARKVIGIELIEEAVEAAKQNAQLNGLDNCEFIAGDVLKVIDDLKQKPDIIVIDPPRDGVHPKALKKIIAFGVEQIVYVSCKPTSLVRDLKVFMEAGYKVGKVRCVDMFPHTVHVECVVGIQRKESMK